MSRNAAAIAAHKSSLRKDILARRARLDSEAVRLESRRVAARVEGLEPFAAAHEALVYLGFRGEIDPTPLIESLWRRGARVLAPRCRPGEDGLLDLACITCMEDLAPGRYGILEPHPETCPAIASFRPSVALIPAVAFDRKGGRLGFGQGYYDRLLAGEAFRETFLIGLAHDFQVVEDIPMDAWDRPVHAVVTAEEIILTERE
jgi:5-formyltetrahydrofolate cyclo-ligase